MYSLDTHIVVWLYQKSLKLLSTKAIQAIEDNEVFISPMVLLELEYLFEIRRIKDDSHTITGYLHEKIALTIDNNDFEAIINTSINEKWTRDPFDRIITAHWKYKNAFLISKDETITLNYPKTIF